jgi:hypothetical protein
MPTSDEDLKNKRDEVKKLRDQVANAESERRESERSLANDVVMRQLEAEEAALRARLAVAKESGSDKAVEKGAQAPLSAAKEQMERAVAQQKAAEANADSKSSNEKSGE